MDEIPNLQKESNIKNVEESEAIPEKGAESEVFSYI